ncbi:uncharacterized protein B0I36DRAFT_430138 [Microdochium trichocladiopsis]|uniref:Uncharacterized protein n=1 Tax=Microdochium trichocladiopsis TaxID=1682393 RepID=A0A9P8YAV6_9PEZI|nr:uncharacterized protein B0I36DRAFT_430138 [Microdochium trichocladiopsis]KAH7032738.1 hypothetical protein B0I36DRAFT_430138 [Microdochium trichocladiopsis]
MTFHEQGVIVVGQARVWLCRSGRLEMTAPLSSIFIVLALCPDHHTAILTARAQREVLTKTLEKREELTQDEKERVNEVVDNAGIRPEEIDLQAVHQFFMLMPGILQEPVSHGAHIIAEIFLRTPNQSSQRTEVARKWIVGHFLRTNVYPDSNQETVKPERVQSSSDTVGFKSKSQPNFRTTDPDHFKIVRRKPGLNARGQRPLGSGTAKLLSDQQSMSGLHLDGPRNLSKSPELEIDRTMAEILALVNNMVFTRVWEPDIMKSASP